MNPVSLNSSRTARILIALLALLALLSFIAMKRSLGRAMQMRAAASTTPIKLKTGEETKVVLEITGTTISPPLERNGVNRQALAGNVLEKQTETLYRRTGKQLTVEFDNVTPVLMGNAPDIHQGAVIHVTAKIGADGVLRADRIVILSGYVKLH